MKELPKHILFKVLKEAKDEATFEFLKGAELMYNILSESQPQGTVEEKLIDYIYEFAWHYGRLYHIGDAEKIKAAISEKFQLPEEYCTEKKYVQWSVEENEIDSLRFLLNHANDNPNKRVGIIMSCFNESGVTITQQLESLWSKLKNKKSQIAPSQQGEEAVEFCDWVAEKYDRYPDGWGTPYANGNYTTAELYQQYLNSKTEVR